MLSRFSEIVQTLPAAQRYWVAYSGGRDSHVLLHALAALRDELPGRLCAIHVNHGLSVDAPRWVAHCRRICRQLHVPLEVREVNARPARGESPEAAARRARYAAFSGLLGGDDCLLTAHHQDDQAETLLLQLLRGSGPHGLAAMPPRSRLGAAWHVRPLLDFPGSALAAYAREAALEWVEDESNFDTGIRRNFLRHQVFPMLETLWPACAETLSRSARHCAEAAELLDALARQDLQEIAVEEGAPRLGIEPLLRIAPARRHNVLRYWLRSLGLPLPRTAHLQRIEEDLLAAAPHREPQVCWEGVELRRYRGWLYALRPQADFDKSIVLSWDLRSPLALPGGNGILQAHPVAGEGLARRHCRRGVTVRYRRGGEHYRIADGHRHSLKKLLQARGIPPWERARLPLVFLDDELVAVADIWLSPLCRAAAGEPGWRIEWQR